MVPKYDAAISGSSCAEICSCCVGHAVTH